MSTVDLKNYSVGEQVIDVRAELSQLLRLRNVYADGSTLCKGIDLSVKIATCNNDQINLSDIELVLLQEVINTLMVNPPHVSGPLFNELIMRVFRPVGE